MLTLRVKPAARAQYDPQALADLVTAVKAAGKPYAAFSMDDCGHDALTLTDRGLRAGAGLARDISSLRRAPAPVSALTIDADSHVLAGTSGGGVFRSGRPAGPAVARKVCTSPWPQV